MPDLLNDETICRSCPVLYVFVEPFRPKENAGLLHEEERGQLSAGLFPSHFLPEHGLPLLQEQLQEEPRPAGPASAQGWCWCWCWLRVLLRPVPATPSGLHGQLQVQAERQSVQSEVSDQRVSDGRLRPVLREI